MQIKKFLFEDKEETLYSDKAKEQVVNGIAGHYLESRTEQKWQEVESQFSSFLSDWSEEEIKELKKRKLCDVLLFFAYYRSCPEAVNRYEIQNILFELSKEKYDFVSRKIDFNNSPVKRMTHLLLKLMAAKYNRNPVFITDVDIEKYRKKENNVSFTVYDCPIIQLARKYDCMDIMPAFCNSEYNMCRLAECLPVKQNKPSDDIECRFVLLGSKDEKVGNYTEFFDDDGFVQTEEKI